MSELTKQALKVENNQSFPNNNAGLITPTALRTFNEDMIDSTVNQAVYTADSASFNSRINAITGSATNTGSLLTTASFDNGTRNLTFTKGDSSTFAVNIPDTSGSVLPSGVVSGSSQINYPQISNIPAGIVSGSSQITPLLPTGVVSGSSQVILQSTTGNLSGSRIDGLVVSASFAISASHSEFSDNSFSASYAVSSSNALFANNATSASNALTASEARNVVIIARNGNASTLPAGTVVHITSAVGDNPIFNTASYDTEALSSNTLGILRNSAPSGADVEVVVNGIVVGVNTDPTLGYVAGDIVYLSANGGFTKVQPQAPNQIVTLGQVLRAQQNNGSIYVSINNGWELNELHNVQITNPQTNQLLAYESASYGLWKNKSTTALGIATTGSNTFSGTQTFQNIIVNGTASINYLQTVTGSAKVIGDAFIVLNNDTPVERYAGIVVVDSGSANTTASFQFDGQTNDWFYEYTGSDPLNFGVALFGPEYGTKGSPVYNTANRVVKGNGGHHIIDSNISDDGSNVSINSNTQITGSLSVNGQSVLVGSDLSPLNAFTTSIQQEVDNLQSVTGSYATTGSNSFVGNQTITGSLSISGSAQNDVRVVGKILTTGSTALIENTDGVSSQYMGVTFGGNIGVFSVANSTEIGLALDGAQWTTNWGNGPLLYVNNTPGDTYEGVFGFQNKANYTDGRITALKRLDVSGSVNIQNTLTASLQEGYVWVGDASGRTTTVPTSSFGGGGTDISSLNAFTASAEIRLTNLELETASLESSVTNLNSFTSSQQGLNGTFATTGSNNFIGNQTITGSVTISGSATNDLTVIGTIKASGSTSSTTINPSNFIVVNNSGGGIGGALDFGNYIAVSTADGSELTLAADANQYSGNWAKGPAIVSNSPSDTYPAIIGFQNKSNWTDGRPTFLTQVDFSNNINVTGSVGITGTITASLQQGFVLVGDVNGRTQAVSTGSFGGGGGSAFPFTGSAQITGSLGITGSISEFVNTLTIASSTASVNFNDGNMFTLTLVTGSVTHITPTNIRRGQTINIQINQPAGASSGSVSFSPNVLFPGGADYQATATGSAIDLLTLVSLDGTNVLAASIKNFQ
jgi:hypothetical protein